MKNNKIKNKTAVVIYNLGGPNNKDEIEWFLFNLFSDKNIINLPNPFRYILAKLISRLRKEEATSNYDKLGGKSPLLKIPSDKKMLSKKCLIKSNIKFSLV